jgi:hypothetical protein
LFKNLNFASGKKFPLHKFLLSLKMISWNSFILKSFQQMVAKASCQNPKNILNTFAAENRSNQIMSEGICLPFFLLFILCLQHMPSFPLDNYNSLYYGSV